MKYLVICGYDDVKLVGNDGNKPITERQPCFQKGLGAFDNYAEAYGHAILHLNSTIEDWDEEEREGCTISRLIEIDTDGFEMHIIGQKDNCIDWARIYICPDYYSYKSKYLKEE